jgi:hypothetical protein
MSVWPDTDDLIKFLNSLVEIDPYAMAELLCVRVPCNQTLANHPSVQVAAGGERSGYTVIAPNSFRVGMLGVLNGFCGTIDDGNRKGWGPISAVYDKGRLLRFERTETVKINAAEPDMLAALKQLAFAARTSGGVAGRDDALCAACDLAEAVIARTGKAEHDHKM